MWKDSDSNRVRISMMKVWRGSSWPMISTAVLSWKLVNVGLSPVNSIPASGERPSDPTLVDTDCDGFGDAEEVLMESDPNDSADPLLTKPLEAVKRRFVP